MRLYAIRAARERVAAERVAAIVEAKARVKAWGAWRFTLSRVDHITQIRHTALQASFAHPRRSAQPRVTLAGRVGGRAPLSILSHRQSRATLDSS